MKNKCFVSALDKPPGDRTEVHFLIRQLYSIGGSIIFNSQSYTSIAQLSLMVAEELIINISSLKTSS